MNVCVILIVDVHAERCDDIVVCSIGEQQVCPIREQLVCPIGEQPVRPMVEQRFKLFGEFSFGPGRPAVFSSGHSLKLLQYCWKVASCSVCRHFFPALLLDEPGGCHNAAAAGSAPPTVQFGAS